MQIIKVWLVDCKGSGLPWTGSAFGRVDIQLPFEMSPFPCFKIPSRNILLVEYIADEQQHHLYEHIPFGFKIPLTLINAIT
jgi:hypothetical protein